VQPILCLVACLCLGGTVPCLSLLYIAAPLHRHARLYHTAFQHNHPFYHHQGRAMSSKSSLLAATESTATTSPQLLVSQTHQLGPEGIRLILASQSPRRKEILDMMGLHGRFETIPSPLDETALQEELCKKDPKDYTQILAQEKAKALAVTINANQPTLVLGSDTIVDLDGHILEKPKDEEDAKRMLRSLSGVQHEVHTGVALYRIVDDNAGPILIHAFTDTARVTFAVLSDEDIDAYVATKEPMDKAGSYGIQGIGGQLVQYVEGDFFAVMGLPMHRTSRLISDAISEILG